MLLKDAISIPTSVRQGDLVFKGTDAAEHTQQTVEQYVVTADTVPPGEPGYIGG